MSGGRTPVDGPISIIFSFSFFVNPATDAVDTEARSTRSATRTLPSFGDTREGSLSPATQRLQHQIREEARKRLADAQSRDLLEIVTAANSKHAKIKDLASLAVLIRSTKARGGGRRKVGFAVRNSFSPLLRRLKVLNGSPLSYSPSSSTASTSDGETYEMPCSSVELNGIAAMGGDSQRNVSSARLASDASSMPEPDKITIKLREFRNQQVDEVQMWFEKVERKDAEDEELKQGLTETMETLVMSPIMKEASTPERAYAEMRAKLRDLRHSNKSNRSKKKGEGDDGISVLQDPEVADDPGEEEWEGWEIL